jgi:hypothetical protein
MMKKYKSILSPISLSSFHSLLILSKKIPLINHFKSKNYS